MDFSNHKVVKINGDLRQAADEVYYCFYMAGLMATIWDKLDAEKQYTQIFDQLQEEYPFDSDEYYFLCDLIRFNNSAKTRLASQYSSIKNEMNELAEKTEEQFKATAEEYNISDNFNFKISASNLSLHYYMNYESKLEDPLDKATFGMEIVENLKSKIHSLQKILADKTFKNNDDDFFPMMYQEACNFFELFNYAQLEIEASRELENDQPFNS